VILIQLTASTVYIVVSITSATYRRISSIGWDSESDCTAFLHCGVDFKRSLTVLSTTERRRSSTVTEANTPSWRHRRSGMSAAGWCYWCIGKRLSTSVLNVYIELSSAWRDAVVRTLRQQWDNLDRLAGKMSKSPARECVIEIMG